MGNCIVRRCSCVSDRTYLLLSSCTEHGKMLGGVPPAELLVFLHLFGFSLLLRCQFCAIVEIKCLRRRD